LLTLRHGRYTIDTEKLKELGWVEEKTWEKGLRETVQWYRKHTNRYPDIGEALKAHPREGLKNSMTKP